MVADALTHLRRTTVDEVGRYFQTHRRRRNVRRGELLVKAVEPLSESPMETRLRVSLIDGGLPRPVAQYELRDPLGAFIARLDLAYPQHRVAVEYDGAWHWARRRDDDRRRDAARALGWVVIVVSAEDLFQTPERMCAAVKAALRVQAA
jgi:very-short-patch-repair endonuclease